MSKYNNRATDSCPTLRYGLFLYPYTTISVAQPRELVVMANSSSVMMLRQREVGNRLFFACKS